MVTFCEGTVVLGLSQVNSGAAYLTIPFTVEGKHFIKAVYPAIQPPGRARIIWGRW